MARTKLCARKSTRRPTSTPNPPTPDSTASATSHADSKLTSPTTSDDAVQVPSRSPSTESEPPSPNPPKKPRKGPTKPKAAAAPAKPAAKRTKQPKPTAPRRSTRLTKARVAGGRTIRGSPPRQHVDPDLTGFVRDYNEISATKPFFHRLLHSRVLESLQVESDFTALLDKLHLRPLVNLLAGPAYAELLHQFYASFVFNITTTRNLFDDQAITFTVNRTGFLMSVAAFHNKLQLTPATDSTAYKQLYTEYPIEFDDKEAYAMLSNDSAPYNPSTSKAITLRNPVHRLLQRLLAYCFPGRHENCPILSKLELFFIWCCSTDQSVNIAFYLLSQVNQVLSRLQHGKPLLFGPIVTHLALTGPSPLPVDTLTKLPVALPIDLPDLAKMKIVHQVQPNQWSFAPNPTAAPPSVDSAVLPHLVALTAELRSLREAVCECRDAIRQLAHDLPRPSGPSSSTNTAT